MRREFAKEKVECYFLAGEECETFQLISIIEIWSLELHEIILAEIFR